MNALFAANFFKSVVYHPDESQLLTCGTDRKLTYWDVTDMNAIRIIDGSMSAEVNTLHISGDGAHEAPPIPNPFNASSGGTHRAPERAHAALPFPRSPVPMHRAPPLRLTSVTALVPRIFLPGAPNQPRRAGLLCRRRRRPVLRLGWRGQEDQAMAL